MKGIVFGILAAFLVGFIVFFLIPHVPTKETSEKLSLKEALGQTLLVGFEGKEMTPELEIFLKKLQPGGVLLLARNIEGREQTKKLVLDLQAASRIPLFVAVDQEGGAISRIPWAQDTPQAALGGPAQALSVGEMRAAHLREVGFNMNLSPVLDSAGAGDYLFTRSFQNNPLFSSLFAFLLIQGHAQQGVLSVPKHYPGYDSIAFNPEISVVPRLKEFPQAEAFSNLFFYFSPEIVMLSHVIYEDVDAHNPLPLSQLGIQKVQEKIGADVLLMSDDLTSIAFLKEYSVGELGSRALFSGVDILLAAGYADPGILDTFYAALWEKAKKNPGLQARVYESSKKILELKEIFYEF